MKDIFFDLLGTVFNHSMLSRDEIVMYLDQCVAPVWQPLVLPEAFNDLQAFPDAKEGLTQLRTQFNVVALSNLPVEFSIARAKANGLPFDGFVSLAEIRRYKPHPECYLHACKVRGVEPSEAMMVTANPTFGPYPIGDIHIGAAVGMHTRLIRRDGGPKDLIALAEELGC